MKKKLHFLPKEVLKDISSHFGKKTIMSFFFNEQKLNCKIKIAVSFKRATTS